jgi:hypothetical protein
MRRPAGSCAGRGWSSAPLASARRDHIRDPAQPAIRAPRSAMPPTMGAGERPPQRLSDRRHTTIDPCACPLSRTDQTVVPALRRRADGHVAGRGPQAEGRTETTLPICTGGFGYTAAAKPISLAPSRRLPRHARRRCTGWIIVCNRGRVAAAMAGRRRGLPAHCCTTLVGRSRNRAVYSPRVGSPVRGARLACPRARRTDASSRNLSRGAGTPLAGASGVHRGKAFAYGVVLTPLSAGAIGITSPGVSRVIRLRCGSFSRSASRSLYAKQSIDRRRLSP